MIVFGPVSSRRFGRSLGIDLSPKKKCCNFDCVYCELSAAKIVDKITNPPSVDDVIREVNEALKIHQNIDVITVTANGEPTLYPNLQELATRLKAIKSNSKLLILSNGTGVLDDEICKALLEFDIVKFSLDSAIQKTFERIDRCSKQLDVANLIEKMSEFSAKFRGELVLEILVVAGLNDKEEEFDALNLAINKISPCRVDISTIHRPPSYPVKSVSSEVLTSLARKIENVACVVGTPLYKGDRLEFSKDELINLLAKRPQSKSDVENSFSQRSRQNLDELLGLNLVKIVDIAGSLFYKCV